MKSKEIMKKWRAKKAREGGRSLSLWLDPETTELLDALRKYFGRSKGGKNKPIITNAIRDLHKSIFAK
jgi:hypothetical protein